MKMSISESSLDANGAYLRVVVVHFEQNSADTVILSRSPSTALRINSAEAKNLAMRLS